MDHCYFAEVAPKVEIRGDLIFICPEGGHVEIAVAPRTLGKFVANANRALDAFHERGRVVPIR